MEFYNGEISALLEFSTENIWLYPEFILDDLIVYDDLLFKDTVSTRFLVYSKSKSRFIMFLIITNFASVEHNFKALSISGVYLTPEERGKSIAKKVYKKLIEKHGGLISGWSQTKYSAGLWSSLSREYNVTLCDFEKKDFIVQRNYVLDLDDKNVYNGNKSTRLWIQGENNV